MLLNRKKAISFLKKTYIIFLQQPVALNVNFENDDYFKATVLTNIFQIKNETIFS